MAFVVSVTLVLLSVAVLVYPFIRHRFVGRESDQSPGEEVQGSGSLELEAIYDAIRTLQLEHQLGNVPDGLYQEQLRAYRWEAARVLRHQLETRPADAEWLLEQEVLVARSSIRSMNGGNVIRCSNCNALVAVGLPSCPNCDVELQPVKVRAGEEFS